MQGLPKTLQSLDSKQDLPRSKSELGASKEAWLLELCIKGGQWVICNCFPPKNREDGNGVVWDRLRRDRGPKGRLNGLMLFRPCLTLMLEVGRLIGLELAALVQTVRGSSIFWRSSDEVLFLSVVDWLSSLSELNKPKSYWKFIFMTNTPFFSYLCFS